MSISTLRITYSLLKSKYADTNDKSLLVSMREVWGKIVDEEILIKLK